MANQRLLRTGRSVLAGTSALALFAAFDRALAQTQLPEIRVTAPSPIVRNAPARPAAPAQPAEPGPAVAEAPPPAPEVPQAGVLPIVTDQFATVTVVPNEEL